jgi:hypothetical protein
MNQETIRKSITEITFLLGVLAETQINYGRHTDARASLDKALEIARNNQENFYLSELFRLKARLAARAAETFAPEDHEQFQLQFVTGFPFMTSNPDVFVPGGSYYRTHNGGNA